MNASLELRQRLSDGPEDMMPCPLCSYLDHPEMLGGDIIHGPDTYLRGGRLMVSTCCRFSAPLFALRGQPRAEIVSEWRKMVAGRLEGKALTTLRKLAMKGLVPSSITQLFTEAKAAA
jgi:hypothetical protein